MAYTAHGANPVCCTVSCMSHFPTSQFYYLKTYTFMRIECILNLQDLKFQETSNEYFDATLVNKKLKELLAALTPTNADPVKLLINLEVSNLGKKDSPTKISFVKRLIIGQDNKHRKI